MVTADIDEEVLVLEVAITLPRVTGHVQLGEAAVKGSFDLFPPLGQNLCFFSHLRGEKVS